MNLLKEHNLKIFNELSILIELDNKIKFEKNKDKNYFSFSINNQYYSIGSYYYNNNIKIDLIGKDDNNFFRILEVFDNSNEIFNYFYENKFKNLDSYEFYNGLQTESKEEINHQLNDQLNYQLLDCLEDCLEDSFENTLDSDLQDKSEKIIYEESQDNLYKYNNDNFNKNRKRKYWNRRK